MKHYRMSIINITIWSLHIILIVQLVIVLPPVFLVWQVPEHGSIHGFINWDIPTSFVVENTRIDCDQIIS